MQGTAGVTEVFEISARDEYNNFVTGCVDDLTSFAGQLTLDGEPAADVVVRGCTEGLPSTYEVEYVLTAAAVYSLALGYGGQALDGTPHEVTIGSSTVSAQDTYLAVYGPDPMTAATIWVNQSNKVIEAANTAAQGGGGPQQQQGGPQLPLPGVLFNAWQQFWVCRPLKPQLSQ